MATKFKYTFRVAARSGAPNGLDIMCGGMRIASLADSPVARKHADLLAAAPALLDALRTVLHDVNQRGYHLSEHALWVSREAIKKADAK